MSNELNELEMAQLELVLQDIKRNAEDQLQIEVLRKKNTALVRENTDLYELSANRTKRVTELMKDNMELNQEHWELVQLVGASNHEEAVGKIKMLLFKNDLAKRSRKWWKFW